MARRLIAKIPGAPGYKQPPGRRQIPTIPSFTRRKLPTLIKKNEAKGITQPEQRAASAQVGERPNQGASARVIRKPVASGRIGKNRRVVKTPSLTNSGGIRNPFKRSRRVGRGKT